HVENLWAYCFEPKEDPFFQYYFTNCYEPENTMVGLEQDQLLSTVHLRQYNLNVRGAVLPTSYMVGVATHPAAR
ncbi:GCN5-related N-acetyltransferase, partial [human gut metagenome]